MFSLRGLGLEMACVPNYLEVARFLQGRLQDLSASDVSTGKWRELLEIAAEEFGVQRDEFVQSRKRSKTALREDAVSNERDVGEEQPCRHSCSEHTELMDPNRWGTLPHELLQLVFAHLPVNKILDLHNLSKDWKETMGARGDSYFLQLCDEAHPKMFALVRMLKERRRPGSVFLVRVFDTKSNTWLALHTSCGRPEADWRVKNLPSLTRDIKCEDGGLVLISLEGSRAAMIKELRWSLFFTVMNPLTRFVHHLPPIPDVQNVHMQDITVDRKTNCYKVLVVVNRRGTSIKDIQVFDSKTGEWSQPNEATVVMFGNQSAHDFAEGRLIKRKWSPWRKKGVVSHSFLKNRLFVLVKDTSGRASQIIPASRGRAPYYIREYVVEYHPQRPPTWLKVRFHRCVPFEWSPWSDYRMMLFSSNGFLIVFAALNNEREPWQSKRGWLYDLSTRTWRDLPFLPGDMPENIPWMYCDTPCEIRWNAYP